MPVSLLSLFDTFVPKDAGSRRVAHDVSYGRHKRQKLDIYAPIASGAALPVIVFYYGGSWSDGSKDNYRFAGRALAALGYVVVIPDYRLVPEVEYPDFLDDCADAVDWVVASIADYGGDPQRLALAGHSAGAYNAMMVALDQRYLQRRGTLGHVRAVAGLSGPYDFFPFDGPISIRVFGAVPDPQSTQPTHHTGTSIPAVFLGHGDRDPLVLARNSFALADKLRRTGAAVTLKTYEKLRHAEPLVALSLPFRWQAPVLEQLRAFFQRYL